MKTTFRAIQIFAAVLSFLFVGAELSSVHADPYPKADSFFERDYLNRREPPQRAENATAKDEHDDSWEANSEDEEDPGNDRGSLRGGQVAGADRVRDYREGRGSFASSSAASSAGFMAIPLGNGATMVIPNGGVRGLDSP